MNRRNFLKLASGAAAAAALPAPILAAAPTAEAFASGGFVYGPARLYLVGEQGRETLLSTVTHVALVMNTAFPATDFTVECLRSGRVRS